MTQKDMEARLIALEAEYAQKKLEADAQIRREQKEIANAEANYHNAVRHHKDVIRTLEQSRASSCSMCSTLRRSRTYTPSLRHRRNRYGEDNGHSCPDG